MLSQLFSLTTIMNLLYLNSFLFGKCHVGYTIKCLSILLTLLIATGTAYAQPKNAEIKPGINAGQFLSAASADNSLQTGQLSVNIPLFNLQGKGIEVPISIAFNSGNITHVSDASTIGLGWSLLAGGVVTRTVRDLRDEQTASPNDVPWQYDGGYLANKFAQYGSDPYDEEFAHMLTQLKFADKEPDVMNYSFLGYSGDIYNKRNANGSYSRKLAPHISFKLEDTSLGYKIIDNSGVEYFFEVKESDGAGMAMSWFLTKIKTLQGGEVSFQYDDDNSTDLSRLDEGGVYSHLKSKRIVRIDYDYGYVIFGSAPREDKDNDGTLPVAKRITTIELYDKSNDLVKGYELGNNSYITDLNPSTGATSSFSKRMTLSTLKEYGPNMQYKPPYEFGYDYHLYLNKASSQNYPWAIPKNTWAHNPVYLSSVDRSQFGDLVPYLEWHWNPDEQEYQYTIAGYHVTSDATAGTVSDYFCMSSMKLPSGGEELYSYEPHTYSYLGTYNEPEVANAFDLNQSVQGKRLWKKETRDNNGNTQISRYKYFDGILINPSIHNSTMYSVNRAAYNTPYLISSPYYTQEPQNSRSGSPVYYARVEEEFLSTTGASNGKKVYYFEKMHSEPATNYIYVKSSPITANRFINLPNVLGGKQPYQPDVHPAISMLSNTYATYLAYPVGRFHESELSKGILSKELTYNAGGQLVKKIENEYTPSFWADQSLFGYIIEKIEDTVYDPNFPNIPTYKFLISQMVSTYGGLKQLLKTRTAHYVQADSIIEEQTFTYTNKNLLRSSTVTQSTGNSIVTEHVYPSDIEFQSQSDLSTQAASIKRMNETNMISYPLQTTSKKGAEYIQGSYTTYKTLAGGAVVTDTTFSLEHRPGILLNQPLVNATGKLERSNSFMPEGSILSYDANVNPTTVVNRGGGAQTTIWGYDGQYPIAKITNYTYDQVQSNPALQAQLALLDDYTTATTGTVRTNIALCNQAIRNSLPQNVTVETFTYAPLVGMTSATDVRGETTYYEYDSFQRLMNVKDKDGKIIKHHDYHYKN